jgi:hypothetical protein
MEAFHMIGFGRSRTEGDNRVIEGALRKGVVTGKKLHEKLLFVPAKEDADNPQLSSEPPKDKFQHYNIPVHPNKRLLFRVKSNFSSFGF